MFIPVAFSYLFLPQTARGPAGSRQCPGAGAGAGSERDSDPPAAGCECRSGRRNQTRQNRPLGARRQEAWKPGPGGRRATCKGPLRGEYLSGGHQPCKARRKGVQGQGNEEDLPWDQCGRTETEGQRAVCKFTRVRWWGLRWVSCPGETCGTPAHLCSQNSLVGPSPNCIKLSFTPSLHFRVFECTIRISQKPRKLSKVQEV